MPTRVTPRERLAWITAAVAILVAAAVIVIMRINQQTIAGEPTLPCHNEIIVYINTDAEMERVAGALREDKRIGQLTTQTKQQTYERYKEVFKDQPELVRIARPDAMPATVEVLPAGDLTNEDLANQLRAEFPKADKIQNFPC